MGENTVLGLFAIVPCLTGGFLFRLYRRVRDGNGETGWPVLLVGNLLLLASLLGGLCLAGEIYFRFVYDSTDSMMFTKVSQRWFKQYYRWNGANLRDNLDYLLVTEPGKRRISFVGDSFTAGQGIKSVEDRFPNRLRSLHPEWEIHVLAMLGFDTGDELQYIANWVSKGYQLDEVVLVYCLNDIGDMIPELRTSVTQINANSERGGWLRRNSYFFNTFYFRFKVWRDPALKHYYTWLRDAYRDGVLWEKQKQRLTAFRGLVESNRGRLAVVTFPLLHDLGPNYEFEFAHQRLDAFWHSLNVPHLDLLPVYRGVDPEKLAVNRFDAHPNEYANALVTPVLEKFLSEQLSAKPAGATNRSEGLLRGGGRGPFSPARQTVAQPAEAR